MYLMFSIVYYYYIIIIPTPVITGFIQTSQSGIVLLYLL